MNWFIKKNSKQQDLPNYNHYEWSIQESGRVLLEATAITIVFCHLFYHAPYGMFLELLLLPYWKKKRENQWIEKRKIELGNGFREFLREVSGALQAGYSMENAWREGERGLEKIYDADSDIMQEIHEMNQRTMLNMPIEVTLEDFALRSGVEDIESFSQIFQFAKRGGGDISSVIRTTIGRLAEKGEIQMEIQLAVSGKMMEQKILCVAPLFILFYLQVTSPGFLAVLYGNLLGVCVMSGNLLLYFASVIWSERIVKIHG